MADTPPTSSPEISDLALERFEAIESISDDKLVRINEWVRENIELLLDEDYLDPSLPKTLNVSLRAFSRSVSAVTAFLFGPEPSLGPYLSALNKRGKSEAVLKVKVLLDGVSVDPARIQRARLKSSAMQAVLPTVSNLQVVCDLRAIFGETKSGDDAKSGTLAGFEPVVEIALTVNDAAANDQVLVFQASELVLQNFLRALERAANQIRTLRESSRALDHQITNGAKESEK